MKNFLFVLLSVVLLAGCEDRFAGPSTEPPEELGNRVIYTRLEALLDGASLVGGIPTGSIVQRDMGSESESVIIPGPAYLLCAPQNGRMLYAQLVENPNPVMSYWQLKISDVDGRNSETILEFGSIVSVLIQDVALSHDGRKVAFVFVDSLDGFNRLIERIYLYNTGTGMAEQLDSIIHKNQNTGGFFVVDALVSQLVFSPNDSRLAVASWGEGKAIRVYNTSTFGRDLLGSNTGPFVAWSPDGQKLLYSKNIGKHISRMIFNPESTTGVYYELGFPARSMLGIIDMARATDVLFDNLPPVFEVAWSPDGTRIAFSQLRNSISLDAGTDIVSFDRHNLDRRDTLTSGAEMASPMTRTHLQWAADNKRLLFSQGYFSFNYPIAGSLGSQIGYIYTENRSSTIMDYGAFGIYWIDVSATSLPTPGKPQPADSLYVAKARD